MFTYVVGEDIEFFGLILSFQFIKELKLEKKKKGSCFIYKEKVKNIYIK